MSKEIQRPNNTGCVAFGCGLVAGGTLETIIPGGPTIVAIGADVAAAFMHSMIYDNLPAPVNLYELGLGVAAEVGRFALGYQIWQSSGDPVLGSLVYLGLGAAHSALVGYRIFDRIIRNNG